MADETAPTAIFIAGPNGSGKSSVVVQVITGPAAANYICADNIARELEAAGYAGSKQQLAREASDLAIARVEQAIRNRQDFSYETVMSHPSKPALMRQATEQGFTSELHYVATENPLINLERVSVRTREGGHDVPSDRIESRYYRSIDQLPMAVAAVKTATIYDNSAAPRLVATINNERKRLQLHGAVPEWSKPVLQALAKTHQLEPAPGLSHTERLLASRAINALTRGQGLGR